MRGLGSDERCRAHTYDARGLIELPEGNGAAEEDDCPEGDEDGCCPSAGEGAPEVQHGATVAYAQKSSDAVADGAADGEGGEEFSAGHPECASRKDEGAERHRGRQ